MAPLLLDQLRAILEALPHARLIAKRDRALLLLGWAGGFRRSELSGMDVTDLDFQKEGLVVTLPKSKTDQQGEGRQVYVPYGQEAATCPVRALEKWLKAARIKHGPVFRGVDNRERVGEGPLHKVSVGRIVKRSVKMIGLPPSRYGGHSLRAGLVTEAAKRRVPDAIIMNQTGHRSTEVMDGYKRVATGFTDNVVTMIGL